MSSYIYYLLGYDEEEITPDPKIVKQRHLLLKQIKASKLRLKSVQPIPTYAEVLKNYKTLLD